MIDLRLGDCIEILKTLEDNSVDSIVVDPPYHLTSIVKRFGKEGSAPAQFGTDGAFARASKGFMGKEWDGGDIAFRTDVWSECLRVLKPGGHLLSFSAPRTYHRMAVAIEDAGFEIRDQIMWIFASGFPKSHNIGKAIDKIEGNEREVLGTKAEFSLDGAKRNPNNHREVGEASKEIQHDYGYKQGWDAPVTKGQSDWEGWGTALKPAHEPICMARKPLSEKSIAQNVLRWGTGGINIDASRIGLKEGDKMDIRRYNEYHDTFNSYEEGESAKGKDYEVNEPHADGRFPANIMFDEEAGKLLDEQTGDRGNGWKKNYGKEDYEGLQYSSSTQQCVFGGGYSGKNTYADKGGASRFFYCPKVSKKERDMGLDDFEAKAQRTTSGGTRDFNARCANCSKKFIGSPNTICSCDNPITDNQVFKKKNNHPTVKPIKLMEYLIKMVTPKGGVVLDCFMGSGSTGIAAKNLGFDFIGIEKEEEYMEIAKQRIG
jgi:site-specific DNA-methyltransferase (adenine-specific)